MVYIDEIEEIVKQQQRWLNEGIKDKIFKLAERHRDEPMLNDCLMDILRATDEKGIKNALAYLESAGYKLEVKLEKPELDIDELKMTVKLPNITLYEHVSEV